MNARQRMFMNGLMKLMAVVVFVVGSVSGASELNDEQNQFRDFAQKVFSSQSTLMESVESINLAQVYAVYPVPAPRPGTYSTLYVGKRKVGVSQESFVKGMRKHIRDVSVAFRKYGLVDYRFYLTADYEMAVQTWTSKTASAAAFSADEMKPILNDGGKILENVIFEGMRDSKL